jgi:NADH:ubiquinone oxidoreductase subunit F (NADH-binding)
VHAPHLVLDGVSAAAAAVGARRAVVAIDRHATPAIRAIEHALDERRRGRTDHVAITVHPTPAHYVAGEETALVHHVNGGEAKPLFTPPRVFERGVGNRPTLVDNVETLAHLALIARFGAAWWRTAGTANDPGTMLVTIAGTDRPGVYEVLLGASLRSVLRNAGAHDVTGVLVGGYFGTWLTPQQAGLVHLATDELRAFGAGLGCGAIAVLTSRSCPLAELARVTRWLAGESAGQCGPCALGLPAIASAVEHIAFAGDRDGRAQADARRWLDMVDGRGACKLPDGAARFVRSGFAVFADHLAEHRAAGRCAAAGTPALLPVPRTETSWR